MPLAVVAQRVERQQLLDERGDRSLLQRIAGGDIGMLDLGRQTMDDGAEQGLVAEDDGGAAAVGNAVALTQPLCGVACLDILCRGGYEGNLLGGDVLIVAIDGGFALPLQVGDEPLLHLLHEIEADEEVVVVLERLAVVLGHLTVEGSLVGQPLLTQVFVICLIDSAHIRPQSQEALLEFAVMVVAEVGEELADDGALLVGEVTGVVKLVDVAQIGEDLLGGRHVLVDIVEVGEQQLAPTVEMVKRFVIAGDTCVDAVQVANEFDVIGHLQLTVAAEKLTDGDIGRRPDGASGETCQGIVEEQRGAFVGEDNGDA